MKRIAMTGWHSLEDDGAEQAMLWQSASGWLLHGVVLRLQPEMRLDYVVRISSDWFTEGASVRWPGGELQLERNAHDDWHCNGKPAVAFAGCTDIDFEFSPVTNLMPVRRAVETGQSTEVQVAWVRHPSLKLVRSRQTYTPLQHGLVHFETEDGFQAELPVDAQGLVTDYPGLWRRISR